MSGTGDGDDLFGGDLPAIPRVRASKGSGNAAPSGRPSRRPRLPSPSVSDSDDLESLPRVARKRRGAAAAASAPSRGRGRRVRTTRTPSVLSDDDDELPDVSPPASSRVSYGRGRPSSGRITRRRRAVNEEDDDADELEPSREPQDDDADAEEVPTRRRVISRRGRAVDPGSSGRGRGRGRRGRRPRGAASYSTPRSTPSSWRVSSRESTEELKDSDDELEDSKLADVREETPKDSDREDLGPDEGDGDQDDDDEKSVEDDDDAGGSPADDASKSEGKVIENPFEGYSEDDLDSQSDPEPVTKPPGSGVRLTMRQRALQGEDVSGELTKLASPRHKKRKPPPDELTKDEEMEMKKQQKARLRHMVHEKRNKEKRAAMVDKVLRGVTSKRKKLSLATEAHVAKVGSRLSNNEVREGCVRYKSSQNGASLAIPNDVEVPSILAGPCRLVAYPPKCERDPKTGKRVLPGT